MNSLRTIGRKTARAQDRIFHEADLVERVEARLFEARAPVFAAPRKRRRAKVPLVAAAAVLVIAVAALLFAPLKATPLQVAVNGRPVDVIAAPELPFEQTVETAVTFSDGSTVRVGKTALARFVSVSARGADIRVEDGHLAANIAHAPNTDWKFRAGPFEVKVIGTRFDLTWDAENEALFVVIAEGTVEISAPILARHQWVRAGETFRGWAKEKRMEIAATPPEKEAPASADTDASGSRLENGLPNAPAASEPSVHLSVGPTPRTPPPSPPDCPETDAAAALASADAQRRQGETETAATAYLALRRCFAGSREAALAAFDLGKTAFDDRGDYDAAAHWLETYLREQRGAGPAREALGRLMEAYVNGHHPESARGAAARYLAQYPHGPHAAFAHTVIEKDADYATDR